MKLVAIQDECMSSGKGTAGTHFQHYFDDFVMTPEEMSPKASIFFFFKNFSGRSLRSRNKLSVKLSVYLESGT